MERIPTIKIQAKNAQGYIVINKCDMTEKQKEFKPVVKRTTVKKKAQSKSL